MDAFDEWRQKELPHIFEDEDVELLRMAWDAGRNAKMSGTLDHKAFLKDLHAVLEKHNAKITVEDHYDGWPDRGLDIRMTVEFSDYTEIDLGRWIAGCARGS